MRWNAHIKKTAAAACALAIGLSVSLGSTIPGRAEAFNIGGALGAVVGTAVQYDYLNKQVNYLDNEGRHAYMQEVQKEVGVNNDPTLNAILDGIMTRLTASIAKIDPSIKEKPYNYFVNQDPSYNAFCTLGHNLTVNQGMFELVNNNADELAVVVAHELAHGQKDHPAKGVKKGMPLDLLNNLYQSQNPNAASIIGSSLLKNAAKATGITKPMEVEADNLAFDYTVGAGYNIGAGAATWQRFIEKMGASKSNFVGELFSPSDHPSHESRRANYSKKLTEYSKKNVAVDDNTGTIKIRGKEFLKPLPDGGMSGHERSYFIAGNLAAVYHNNASVPQATYANGVIQMGVQPIMAVAPGEDARAIVEKLNSLR